MISSSILAKFVKIHSKKLFVLPLKWEHPASVLSQSAQAHSVRAEAFFILWQIQLDPAAFGLVLVHIFIYALGFYFVRCCLSDLTRQGKNGPSFRDKST